MKIRQGFVSNSSSSSFIIALDAGLEPTVENFHQAIFGNKDYHRIYDSYFDPVESIEIARRVEAQVRGRVVEGPDEDGTNYDQSGKVLNLAHVAEADYDYDMIDNFKDGKNTYDWDRYNEAVAELNAAEADRIKARFPNHDFYVVSFSDNDGEGAIEHGPGLNDSNNVIRYSHH